MDFQTFMNSYFTLALVSKLIERKTPVRSIVYDEVFSTRTTTSRSRIRVYEMLDKVGNVAVVARGSASLKLDGSSSTRTEIEPMPVKVSDFIAGATLNDLKALYGAQEGGADLVAAEIDRLVLKLMRSAELTRNALCAQAMTGKIDYMMRNDNGAFERYQVAYGDGTTLSFAPAKKWNDDACTLADIIDDLDSMETLISDAGFSGDIRYLVGKKAFKAVANKIAAMPNDQRADGKVEKGRINIAGYELIKDSITYKDRDASGAEVTKYEVDPEKIVAFASDIPEITYCAVDDVDGNLEALPFFSKTVKTDDPSGYKVIGESKPMPLVAAKAFCWATVFDGDIVNATAYTINADAVGVEADNVNVDTGLVTYVEKTWTEAGLTALTKDAILAIATERGYEMTTTSADLKADIITEFLTLQTAAQA